MKKNQLTLSGFLAERPQPLMPNRFVATKPNISVEEIERLNTQIGALARHAQDCLDSPLIRLPEAHTKLGIGRSTYLKKVQLKQLPQPVYCGPRVAAYREVDLDMVLAAQTLASRHGFMLDLKAFVAAMSAPINASTKVCA